MYLETMQEVYTNVSKVLVDSRSGSNLLYLPLEQLIRPPASSPAVAAPRTDVPSPATTGAASVTLDSRSRAADQRTRERDAR
jgi:membrane protease subunit HflK